MKFLSCIFFVAFMPFFISAQINWLYDMKLAQAISVDKGKLIVADFTASWCTPCRKMERELWSEPEMLELSGKLVFLKIDIDIERQMASNFNITSIPNVLIISPNYDVIWERKGYSGFNEVYFNAFLNTPNDVTALNEKFIPFLVGEATDSDHLAVGIAYQNMGKEQTNQQLKSKFISLSRLYFKNAQKKKGQIAKEAELRNILNYVYGGSLKKGIKKLSKFEENYFDGDLRNLWLYVNAYCYKELDELEKSKEFMDKINDSNLLEKFIL